MRANNTRFTVRHLTYTSFVVDQVKQIAPASLLDMGCGDGRLIFEVKGWIPQIVGVDLSEKALAFARAFNPDIEFVCADIATVSGKYECVTLIEVLEHIPDEEVSDFIQNVARLVHRDGCLLILVPTVNVPLNKKHYRHYDLEQLKGTLAPYFEIMNHWWLYRHSVWERFLRLLMVNRFFVLKWTVLLDVIWQIHKRKTYFADARTGAHLVCVAKPRGMMVER